MLPLYIVNRDLLTPIKGMVEWLGQFSDTRITIVDCASTYPPLLDWYDKVTKVTVIRLPTNAGHFAGHRFLHQVKEPYYVYSDGDFGLSGVPADGLDLLQKGLDKYPHAVKVGFSQRLDDLPRESPIYQRVMAQQACFWEKRIDTEFYEERIDTGFAMYRRGDAFDYGPALLTAPPYSMRHLSWYITQENLTEEWRHMLRNASPDGGQVWSHLLHQELEL